MIEKAKQYLKRVSSTNLLLTILLSLMAYNLLVNSPKSNQLISNAEHIAYNAEQIAKENTQKLEALYQINQDLLIVIKEISKKNYKAQEEIVNIEQKYNLAADSLDQRVWDQRHLVEKIFSQAFKNANK